MNNLTATCLLTVLSTAIILVIRVRVRDGTRVRARVRDGTRVRARDTDVVTDATSVTVAVRTVAMAPVVWPWPNTHPNPNRNYHGELRTPTLA